MMKFIWSFLMILVVSTNLLASETVVQSESVKDKGTSANCKAFIKNEMEKLVAQGYQCQGDTDDGYFCKNDRFHYELACSGSSAAIFKNSKTGVEERQDQPDNQVVATYRRHRQEFDNKKKLIASEVEQERQEILGKISSLERELATGKKHLKMAYRLGSPELPEDIVREMRDIRTKNSRYNEILDTLQLINGGGAVVLSPWAVMAGSYAEKILFVFLPITVFNILLFLFFRHRQIFIRYKKKLIVLLVILLLASATSLMAATVDKRQQVETKLRYAENMLRLSGNRKAIVILENKHSKNLSLPPEIFSGDLNLPIYKNVVVDSPEYYITLAALYMAEKKTGKAIEAMTSLAEKNVLKGTPSHEIIVSTIQFLVKNGYTDVAATAVQNHAGLIYDTGKLLELMEYLKKHNMQVSAEHVMKIVEKKTTTPAGLVKLANYFYALGKVDKAISLLDRALKKSKGLDDILLVAQSSVQHQAKDIFKKIPARAERFGGTVKQFLDLAEIYNGQGESAQVADCLQRAVSDVRQPDQVKKMVSAVIKYKQGSVMDRLINRVVFIHHLDLQRSPKDKRFRQAYTQCLAYVTFFSEQKRQEDAVSLFERLVEMIKKNRQINEQYINLMVGLSQDALRYGFKKQAGNIILRLGIKLKSRAFATFLVLHENFLGSIHGVPDKERVALPLYYGLINEDINQFSKSEREYMRTVVHSLEKINKSYGDELPETMNQFYLLGRLWQKENRMNVLASLDRVYTLLENRILENIKEQERDKVLAQSLARLDQVQSERQEQISLIEKKNEELKERKAEYQRHRRQMIEKAETELDEKRAALNELWMKMVLKVVSTFVILSILVGLLIGCGMLSWKYSQRLKEHRMYGFTSKFVELNGWLRVLSILGCLSGIVLVIVSQTMQIFQKIHELALQRTVAANYLAAGNMDAKKITDVQKKQLEKGNDA